MSSSDQISLNSKAEIIKQYGRKEGDSGSPEVQVALLTHRIKHLTGHFASHKEDNHSMRGMMRLVTKRKKLLTYLKDRDLERYRKIIADLGLRK
jgi:small subunit ribosomal protein S15